jgi:eukaryotic translation initiation factor 2C
MLKIGATRLEYPSIKYGNQSTTISQEQARWNLRNLAFLKTNNRKIAYATLYQQTVPGFYIEGSQREFERQLRSTQVGTPDRVRLQSGAINFNSPRYIDDIRARLQDAKRNGANLAILVLRNKSQDVYSAFKYLADRVFGIASIVMVQQSKARGNDANAIQKGLMQYIGNIMMKANLKMAGVNHSAESTKGNISTWLGNTLVLGADVTHPSNGAIPGCPSVAALVGSVDDTGGKFLGSLSLQSKGKKEVWELVCFLHIC